MIHTGQISSIFRKLGLIHLLDKIKYHYQKIKLRNQNKQFKEEYPQVILPPDYLLFEAYKLDYQSYYLGGLDSAKWLIAALSPYTDFIDITLLDWGCGPARIIRHLPTLLNNKAKIIGSDYNHQTIDWCRENIKDVHFLDNDLVPPLNLKDAEIEVAYAISIITHLSLHNQVKWLVEIYRVLKPGGVFLFTSQGRVFTQKLVQKERNQFDKGDIVDRGRAIEGHRVFSSFHPPQAVQSMIKNTGFTLLSHTPGQIKEWGLEQDVWIVRKDSDFLRSHQF